MFAGTLEPYVMLIKRKVAVKVLVTEQFKQQLSVRLRTALEDIEASQQQLEHQGRRYLSEVESRDPAQGEAFRRKLERQKRKQAEVRSRLAEELVQAEKLEPGTEYFQGTLEGLAEIQIGDNLSEKLQDAELVVKDGIIVEIRRC